MTRHRQPPVRQWPHDPHAPRTHPIRHTPGPPRHRPRRSPLEADPELVRIRVTVQARGADRRTTLDDLTRRNNTVLDLIKSHGPDIHRLDTGAFSLTPEFAKHGRGERVRTYHGHVRLTVELTDFTTLGELTTRLGPV